MSYTISEVSKITGVSKLKLLSFINKGIVVPNKGTDEQNINSYMYTDNDIFKISQTVMYQQLGYSLSKIEEMCKKTPVGEAKKLNKESI